MDQKGKEPCKEMEHRVPEEAERILSLPPQSPVVSRLLELEALNQRLSDQKHSLEHQLIHVLERFASTGPTGSQMTKDDVKDIIRQTIQEMSVPLSVPQKRVVAPLAEPDYSGLRGSLTESVGGASLVDYSSLSDAYEDLCLNKNFIDEVVTSESGHRLDQSTQKIPSTFGEHVDTKQPIRKMSETLVSRSKFFRTAIEKTPTNSRKFPTRYDEKTTEFLRKSGEEWGLSETLTRPVRFGKRFDFPVPETSTSNLSLLNATFKQCGIESDSTNSSAASCSMFSSSSDSVPGSKFSSPLQIRRKQNMTGSLPASPIGQTSRPSAHKAWQHHKIMECSQVAAKYDPQKPVPQMTPREEVIAAMRRLYGLPNATPEVMSPGAPRKRPTIPPQVKITRRGIKPPVQLEDSSESASVNSHMGSQTDKFHRHRFQQMIGALEDDYQWNYRPIRFYERDIQTPSPTRRTVDPLSLTYSPKSHYHRTCYALNFPRMSINLFQCNLTKPEDYFESKDFFVLEKISHMIEGLDSYTCCRGQCVLLHRLRPPFATYTPMLRSINAVQHSHESSEVTSDNSATLVERRDNGQDIHAQNGFVTCGVNGGQHQRQPVETEQSLDSYRVSTHDPNQPSQELDESEVIHSGVLHRLSNRFKIWRAYHAELTHANLCFYSPRATTLRTTPRICIPITEIRTLRKPHHLTSSNIGLASKLFSPKTHSAQIHAGSVPVSRKFKETSMHGSTEQSQLNYAHFEIVLANGKTHRFRGTNSTETELWLTHIRRVFRISLANEILLKCSAQLVMQGWLRRIKRGEAAWLWCRLMGHYLVYTSSENSRLPSGYKSLHGIHIRTVDTFTSTKNYAFQLPTTQHDDCKTTTISLSPDFSNLPIELTSSSDSDILTAKDLELRNRTIALWSDRLDPIYLVCSTQAEFEQWRDHLMRACQQLNVDLETMAVDASSINQRLCEVWRLLINPVHANEPHHTDLIIRHPLSKTTEKVHAETSIRLFACLLFLSYPQIEYRRAGKTPILLSLTTLNSTSYWLNKKYRVLRILTERCFNNPELKDELFLQLVKQVLLSDTQLKRLSRRSFPQRVRRSVRSIPLFCSDPRSRDLTPDLDIDFIGRKLDGEERSGQDVIELTATQRSQLGGLATDLMTDSEIKFPTSGMINTSRPASWWPVLVIWECLGILLTIFLPSTSVLSCLELVLALYVRKSETDKEELHEIHKELSRYAAFCREMLHQTFSHGGRTQPPSAFEVASISIRNPHTHKYPFSMPIRLPDGNAYEVVSFNGGTDFNCIITQIVQKLDIPYPGPGNPFQYAIYLCLSGSSKPKRYLYLRPNWKVCDVLSLYERAVITYNQPQARKLPLEEISAELVFRIQAFSWRILRKMRPDRVCSVLSLLTHQFHMDLLTGTYAIACDVVELTDLIAYLCRANYRSYTEMQRRKEISLSQVMQTYFPQTLLAELSADNKAVMQLKLLLIDRWSTICKSSNHSPDATRSRNDVQYQARLNYLRLLRRVSPLRFGTTTFPARIDKLPQLTSAEVVWLVPQEIQLTILALRSEDSSKPTTSDSHQKPQIYCVCMIPYSDIQSFGGQYNGAFYITYTTKTDRIEDQSRKHPSNANRMKKECQWRSGTPSKNGDGMLLIHKLQVRLLDLNAVMELTETLNFFFSLSQKNNGVDTH